MATPTPSTGMWASLGTLDSYMDFTTITSFGHTFITGKVISNFLSGEFGGEHVIYTVTLMSLTMCLATAAYVVVSTVQAGVNFMKGFYYNYAVSSQYGNLLYAFEVAVIIAWELWALVITIMSFVGADLVWKKTEARMAEAAADSVGLENALTWDVVFKVCTLIMVGTIAVVVSGWSLGDVADELVTYFAYYDDDTKTEGDEKTDSSNKDPAGTSAQNDLLNHTVTTFYSYFVFSVISYGATVFMSLFDPLETTTLVCDFNKTAADYDGVFALLGQIKNYETCMSVIEQIFEFEDQDKNGIVTKCEDANFQHAVGKSTEAYSTKFAGQYTRKAFINICHENFPNHTH